MITFNIGVMNNTLQPFEQDNVMQSVIGSVTSCFNQVAHLPVGIKHVTVTHDDL